MMWSLAPWNHQLPFRACISVDHLPSPLKLASNSEQVAGQEKIVTYLWIQGQGFLPLDSNLLPL